MMKATSTYQKLHPNKKLTKGTDVKSKPTVNDNNLPYWIANERKLGIHKERERRHYECNMY